MNEINSQTGFSYDSLPYTSLTFAQTYPDRLATIAKIYGMNPANVENCRVLELGCGDGTNLNSMAYLLPESEFVGVDLSAKQISDAKIAVDEIGLKNVQFYELDVLELNAEKFGKFDFIIAHGLFSWVPPFVREKVLQIYRELLQPQGVGYLSYNAYPGCHLRDLARKVMRFHTKDIKEPLKKVENSLQIVNFLNHYAKSESVYQKVLEYEFSNMINRLPDNIFHDELEENNQPFYFHEFAAELEKNNLQFLSETEVYPAQIFHLAPDVQGLMQSLGNDIVKIEQYLDFLTGRRFRQSLVCQREILLNRQLTPEILPQFLLSASVKCSSENIDLTTTQPEKFISENGSGFDINHPLTKAALFYLGQIWSRAISLDELLENSIKLLQTHNLELENPDADVKITGEVLFNLFGVGVVELHVFQASAVYQISEKPKVSDFARWQAKKGNSVTNLHGLSLMPDDDLMRQLIILADGARTENELIEELQKDSKYLQINNLSESVHNTLAKISQNSLLIQ